MVQVPFASGVVAAFIFLIFELLVFPVLIYSTSVSAAVLLRPKAKKDNEIRLKTLRFPLWNEGLLHDQWSHKLLLLFRFVLIAIPVFIETRLEPVRVFVPVSRIVENAFVVAPVSDWFEYVLEWQSNIHNLSGQSTVVFDHCSRMNGDGWLTATVANVSARSNSRELVQCIGETRTPIYRSIPNVDAIQNPFKYEYALSLGLTWIEGAREAFPSDSMTAFIRPNRTVMRIDNLTMLDSPPNFECATYVYFSQVFYSEGQRQLNIMCEKVTGNVTEFYGTWDVNFTSTPRQIALRDSESGRIQTFSATIELRTYYVERLEFNDTRITAAQWINSHWGLVPPTNLADFYWILRQVLYTRASNVTVQVHGSVSRRTEIGNLVIALGGTELVAVLLFGLVMLVYSKLERNDIQMPNTLNGLSQLWAQTTTLDGPHDEARHSTVKLRLGMGYESENEPFLEPEARERYDGTRNT